MNLNGFSLCKFSHDAHDTVPGEVKLLKKECFNRWYSLMPYYAALTVSRLPFQVSFLIDGGLTYYRNDITINLLCNLGADIIQYDLSGADVLDVWSAGPILPLWPVCNRRPDCIIRC